MYHYYLISKDYFIDKDCGLGIFGTIPEIMFCGLGALFFGTICIGLFWLMIKTIKEKNCND